MFDQLDRVGGAACQPHGGLDRGHEIDAATPAL
jgi:hypothetical protein